jgi:hypothetical protein
MWRKMNKAFSGSNEVSQGCVSIVSLNFVVETYVARTTLQKCHQVRVEFFRNRAFLMDPTLRYISEEYEQLRYK